ncbi:hypothetical protein GGQ22_18950 [Nocardioides sp. zg-579]|uniref:Uncharacterized protein n=1 Tax=Nocardioides marmotae TaxID=2663857 RepID=A0A6I3JGL3_9ACTN|nr:hypothetical protein [Nocardioides marmotae]MCR6033494.1 hypothetical protein [Gordonia jinghuaiqii]MTB97152.1 hypothetical protein [Nocardioides marmotae]QKE00801.1 hypothetical protein HPC71_06720 [Nocardioides marmotae]
MTTDPVPASGRSEVLTPAPPVRVAFTLVGAFFGAALVWAVTSIATGDLEWTTTNIIAVPLVVLFGVASLAGVVQAWTSKVWVDHDRDELHQVLFGRDVAMTLQAPTTARLDYRRQALGSTVSGTWKVVVTHPDRQLTLNTPYVRDIADVLRILRPALARNPDLPADDYTRRALADPSAPLVPPQVAGRTDGS